MPIIASDALHETHPSLDRAGLTPFADVTAGTRTPSIDDAVACGASGGSGHPRRANRAFLREHNDLVTAKHRPLGPHAISSAAAATTRRIETRPRSEFRHSAGVSSVETTRLAFGLVAAPDGAVVAAFDELAAWMRAHAAVDLERRTATTYQGLAASVRDGSSDVAWLPPVAYAWLAEAVTPIGSVVRAGRTSYSAALVVRRDDERIASLADLKGTRAGWVDPWSAAGYVVPRIELARAGVDPTSAFVSETFHGTHRDALLALARGDCDVAGTYARSPEGDEATTEGGWSGIEELDARVLAVFGSIPTDVIAVRRNLAPASYERFVEALRQVAADATARALLHAVFGGDELHEGLEPGHDALRRAFERATANGLFD
ncbi:MAG: PhnD/SsuA/transferrin family substrate-binding protein [Labilithrix sp.]|nr:PhnD/SsuA/transferrin family substrate-binding protein [Labilithrix sp.]